MSAEYMHIGIPVTIFAPTEIGPGVRIAFVIKDGAIIELYEQAQ